MDKFEELIRAVIAKSGRVEGRPAGGFEHGFTVDDLCTAVKSITCRKDAIAFYKGYVAFIKSLPPERKRLNGKTEEQVARTNIGWMFWKGMTPEAVRMWNESTAATHPIFGAVVPTVEEAFRTGRQFQAARTRRRISR